MIYGNILKSPLTPLYKRGGELLICFTYLTRNGYVFVIKNKNVRTLNFHKRSVNHVNFKK